MLFAAAGVLIMALVVLGFVGISDARLNVERLERELAACQRTKRDLSLDGHRGRRTGSGAFQCISSLPK